LDIGDSVGRVFRAGKISRARRRDAARKSRRRWIVDQAKGRRKTTDAQENPAKGCALLAARFGTEGYKGSGRGCEVEVCFRSGAGWLNGLGSGLSRPDGPNWTECSMGRVNVSAFRPLKDFKRRSRRIIRASAISQGGTPPSEGFTRRCSTRGGNRNTFRRPAGAGVLGIEVEDATWRKIECALAGREYKRAARARSRVT